MSLSEGRIGKIGGMMSFLDDLGDAIVGKIEDFTEAVEDKLEDFGDKAVAFSIRLKITFPIPLSAK